MFKKLNISLLSILMVNFIGTLGFSIVIPFLVILVDRYGGNAFIYGVVGSIYPLFQFIGAPILGRWSDNYGRRPVLLLSQLGTLISWVIFLAALFLPIRDFYSYDSELLGMFTISLPLIVLSSARALDGLTGGNISVAQAYMADITIPKDRNKNYGRLSASSSLGFIIGPALAGILGVTAYKEKIPVLAAIAISLFTVVLIARFLPESKSIVAKKERPIPFMKISKLPHIAFILALYFVMFLGFNIFYTSFPVHAINTLNWDAAKIGVYFAILSVFMVMVQTIALPALSKRFSDAALVVAGSLILSIGFLSYYSLNEIVVYTAALLFALGNGTMWPSFLSIISKIASPDYQGVVQGVSTSAGSVASIVGLILGGLLYVHFNSGAFLISAFLIFVVFVLSFRLIGIKEE